MIAGTTLAVMSNPGNMTNGDLLLFILIMCCVACIPVILTLGVILIRLAAMLFKMAIVGGVLFIIWRFINLSVITNFKNAFMEAYGKTRN